MQQRRLQREMRTRMIAEGLLVDLKEKHYWSAVLPSFALKSALNWMWRTQEFPKWRCSLEVWLDYSIFEVRHCCYLKFLDDLLNLSELLRRVFQLVSLLNQTRNSYATRNMNSCMNSLLKMIKVAMQVELIEFEQPPKKSLVLCWQWSWIACFAMLFLSTILIAASRIDSNSSRIRIVSKCDNPPSWLIHIKLFHVKK